MDLLAEYGIDYTCDLFHDDQPMPVNVKSGRLISMPYSLEMNDVIVYNTQSLSAAPLWRSDQAAIRSAARRTARRPARSCASRSIPISSGSRIASIRSRKRLRYIAQHDDVWLATGREIAEHFYAHSYDPMVEAIAAAQA